MTERNDKSGLERSVLTYVDIAVQQPAKYILVVDESYGKALFSVDYVDALEHEIIAYRRATQEATPATIVTRFSPALVWRVVNREDVYIQSTRTVMEREAEETKVLRTFREEVIKAAGLDVPVGGIPEIVSNGHGQYL